MYQEAEQSKEKSSELEKKLSKVRYVCMYVIRTHAYVHLLCTYICSIYNIAIRKSSMYLCMYVHICATYYAYICVRMCICTVHMCMVTCIETKESILCVTIIV